MSSEKSESLFDDDGKFIKGQEKDTQKMQLTLTKEELDNINKKKTQDKKALAE